jgi:hypothetical protein
MHETQKRSLFDSPVKDPVLDTAIVITSGVASSRDGIYDLSLPICLDKILKIFSVCGGRIWDIVIREPALQLSLMPFVVS